MPAKVRLPKINPEKYAMLVAASLPIPPHTEADNDRLIKVLESLDEREDLTA